MVVLGVLLLAAVVVVVLAMVTRGGTAAPLDLHWFTVHTSVLGVFVTGVVTVLVALIGAWLLRKGLARARRRRSELRTLRRRAATQSTATPGSRSAERGGSHSADDHFDSTPRDDGQP
jgi:hypothetical protein